jgi:hypothetical protein
MCSVFGSYVNILFEPLKQEFNIIHAETNLLLNVQRESGCSLWEHAKLRNTLRGETAYLLNVGADNARLSLCFKLLIKRIDFAYIIINIFAVQHTYL